MSELIWNEITSTWSTTDYIFPTQNINNTNMQEFFKVSVRKKNDNAYANNNYILNVSQSIRAIRNVIPVTASRVTTEATVTYFNHGYKVGDSITLSGTAPFNGTYTITSVTKDSFNFTVANSGATSDSPNLYVYVITVNEYIGGTAAPVNYTVTQTLAQLQGLLPSGSFIYITQVNTRPNLAYYNELPSNGNQVLLFTGKIVNFYKQDGATITLSDIDRTTTTVTATSSAAHNLQVGEYVTVSGASNGALNGTFVVVTVPSTTTFTYTTSSSGTITNNSGSAVHIQTVFNHYQEGAVNYTYVANELFTDIETTLSIDVAPVSPIAASQALSGAGAIALTSYNTYWTTTAANAGTLANGTYVGQLKRITMVVDGGDGTLTPTSLSGGTTITFNDANDFVELQWNGSAWVIRQNVGCTVA